MLFSLIFTEHGLIKVYKEILPKKCCPLFRSDQTRFVSQELFEIYLPPKYVVHEYREGCIVNSHFSSLTSILDVIEQAERGKRIIVSAEAGLGKSAFSSDSTRLWCDGKALDKYKLLYLLLPRYIHRHPEPIERIICTDLELHTASAEAGVRRAIKSDASNMAFIIDGYDEVMERDQRVTNLNKVISGEVAKDAMVVITTRPHCVDLLDHLCNRSYILVKLQGLTKADSEKYIQRMCATEIGNEDKKRAQRILSQIPEEARHVPLLLKMAVIIYMQNRQNPVNAIRTVSSVIGRVIATFLSLQVEKDEARDTLPLYESPLDLQNQHTILKFAEMSFESIKNKELEFTSETLQRFQFHQSKALSQLGFLEVTNDADGNVQTARCLHNQILEYCAAIHVAKNLSELEHLINTKHSAERDPDMMLETNILSDRLAFWQDTMIFAVEINHEILANISGSNVSFSLRVSGEDENDQHQCLELSYEARLIHETESTEAREQFCKALMEAPLEYARTVEVIRLHNVYYCLIQLY